MTMYQCPICGTKYSPEDEDYVCPTCLDEHWEKIKWRREKLEAQEETELNWNQFGEDLED